VRIRISHHRSCAFGSGHARSGSLAPRLQGQLVAEALLVVEAVTERWIAAGQGPAGLPGHERGESLDVGVTAGVVFRGGWFRGREHADQMTLLAECADDSPD
jgi:hypothetical protein